MVLRTDLLTVNMGLIFRGDALAGCGALRV